MLLAAFSSLVVSSHVCYFNAALLGADCMVEFINLNLGKIVSTIPI